MVVAYAYGYAKFSTMKLKNVHLQEDFLEFVKSEANRRGVYASEIIREIVQLGEPKYRRKHKINNPPQVPGPGS